MDCGQKIGSAHVLGVVRALGFLSKNGLYEVQENDRLNKIRTRQLSEDLAFCFYV